MTPPSKPLSIALAVNLMWAAFVLGPVKAILDPTIRNHPEVLLIGVFVFVTQLFFGLLIWKIGKGRSWTRITYAVMFGLGVLPFVFFMLEDFLAQPLIGVLSFVDLLLQGYAIYLIYFTPAKEWFRKAQVTIE